MAEEKKKWYHSKTKLGAALVGLSAIIGTIGGYLQGGVDPTSVFTSLIAEIGTVLAVFGIRDMPFVNRPK